MRKILQYILKVLSRIVLWKYQSEIIGITGSVGKTGAKEAVYHVLKKHFKVRRSISNYNTEIGAPLTVLGVENGGSSLVWWLVSLIKGIGVAIYCKNYPEILILEMGVDKPGDMEYLTDLVPVKIGIITAIGEFPSHLEFFMEKDRLIDEKALLVKSLPKKGLAVLNYDDLSVRAIGRELPKDINISYYGFGDGADLKIENFDQNIDNLAKGDFGTSFKLNYKGSIVPIKLKKVLGEQHCFAAAAAAGVGLYFGLNLVEISAGLRKYRSLAGRAKLLKGIKNTWIIDDSYNASPLAVLTALDILNELGQDQARKIAVLGDMLELGEGTEAGHRQVGDKTAQAADVLFAVGARAKFISDEAIKQGMDKSKIFEFDRAQDAKIDLQKIMQEGDVVLIKGSRSMHMEQITKEVMAHPEKADKLLVKK